MICPKCNNYISHRYKHCPFCGLKQDERKDKATKISDVDSFLLIL